MVRMIAAASTMLIAALVAVPAAAQAPTVPARGPYVPSTHSPGCGGLLCDPVDPSLATVPAPPCAGLICGQPPITAAEAARIQEERARAATVAAGPAEPARPPGHARRHSARSKTKVPKAVSLRTPARPAPDASAAK